MFLFRKRFKKKVLRKCPQSSAIPKRTKTKVAILFQPLIPGSVPALPPSGRYPPRTFLESWPRDSGPLPSRRQPAPEPCPGGKLTMIMSDNMLQYVTMIIIIVCYSNNREYHSIVNTSNHNKIIGAHKS